MINLKNTSYIYVSENPMKSVQYKRKISNILNI